MKKIFTIAIVLCAFNFANAQSEAQKNADNVLKYFKECHCKEVLMISGNYEKAYTGAWLNHIRVEDEYLTFQKDENVHRWDVESITFIEQGSSLIRVYLNDKVKN